MRLDGIHHITSITTDAQSNVDFYAGLLGLRFVKKTVNFDAPEVYHLYYADEVGTPGSVLTYFEFPEAGPGRAGAGMIHTIGWRVGSSASLDYWADRLETAGIKVAKDDNLTFEDPEGMRYELVVDETSEPPLVANDPRIDPAHALRGFSGVHAYSAAPDYSEGLLEGVLGFEKNGDAYTLTGPTRSAYYVYDRAQERGIQGAGTVHHIAWASEVEDHGQWHARVSAAHPAVTEIIDRTYFKSIYFREPSGVLFEIATKGPGFTIDETVEELGMGLRLPPQHEHLRDRLVKELVPLKNPRSVDG